MNGHNPERSPDLPPPVATTDQQQARDFFTPGRTEAEVKPAVNIPGGIVSITESAEALFAAIAPRKQLFYRGGVVVELVKEGDLFNVQVLDAVSAQSRFEKYVRFFRPNKASPLPALTTISEANCSAGQKFPPQINSAFARDTYHHNQQCNR